MPDYQGVMVAFFLKPDEAQALAIEDGQEPEQLHLTLAYLGEAPHIENLDKLEAVVAQWAEAQEPITGHVGGVGLFNKREEDGTQAFYASLDCPEIQPLRADLVDHLEAHGYKLATEHGFNPHITLAYVSGGQLPMGEAQPLELGFDQVSLSIADERKDFDMAGHAQEVIRQENGKWFLYSKDGSRKLGGPYDTEDQAKDRERQVQFFKHQKDAAVEPDPEQDLDHVQDAADHDEEDAVTEARLADDFDGHELGFMSVAYKRGGGPVGLSELGKKQAQGLVEKGLAYFDELDRFRLTMAGIQMARALARERKGEASMPDPTLIQESERYEGVAEVWPVREADGDLTGKAWDVTLIGAKTPAEVVQRSGQEYVKSKNGRLYSCQALESSAEQWNGVKVYDNHLTDQEFEARQGMRSVAKEWVGTVVKPYWDAGRRQLRGILKVVDEALARKLLEAHKHGILSTIGLSIDTLPTMRGGIHEGQPMQFIDGFQKIFSVDLVAEPAAGGGFNRLIASVIEESPSRQVGDTTLTGGNLIEWIQSNPEAAKDMIKSIVREAMAANGSGSVAVQRTGAGRKKKVIQ